MKWVPMVGFKLCVLTYCCSILDYLVYNILKYFRPSGPFSYTGMILIFLLSNSERKCALECIRCLRAFSNNSVSFCRYFTDQHFPSIMWEIEFFEIFDIAFIFLIICTYLYNMHSSVFIFIYSMELSRWSIMMKLFPFCRSALMFVILSACWNQFDW